MAFSDLSKALQGLTIVVTVIHVVGIALTIYRLLIRLRIGRLWWDDFWATVALVLDLPAVAMLWWSLYYDGHVVQEIAVAWLGPTTFTCLIWGARLSISTAIMRVLHDRWTRSIAFGISIVFALAAAGNIAAMLWACGHTNDWHQAPLPFCVMTRPLIVAGLITDFLSVIVLVWFPLHVLWRVNLPPKERRMILLLFSASILMLIFATVHAILGLGSSVRAFSISAEYEAPASLIVCNLLVVVTRVYQSLGRNQDDDYDSISEAGTTPHLTTEGPLSLSSFSAQWTTDSSSNATSHPSKFSPSREETSTLPVFNLDRQTTESPRCTHFSA